MSDARTHQIVVGGRPSDRLLRPFLDDFTINRRGGDTVLVGVVRDPSHLHGLVTHLSAVNIDLISITPHDTSGSNDPLARRRNHPEDQHP